MINDIDAVVLNISIDSSPENIWKVLVDENEFNACFETIEMHCDEWKVGGTIYFESSKNNTKVNDQAIIRLISEHNQLSYAYQKEHEQHVIEVSFTLKPIGHFTYLSIEGKNFKDDFERSHSENVWINMLQKMKTYCQKK